MALPCIAFATGPGEPGTNVTFGTLAYSTPALHSHGAGDVTPRFSNCGTATERLLIAGIDATNVCTGICELTLLDSRPLPGTPCPTLNTYGLAYGVDAPAINTFDKTNTSLVNPSNASDRYTAGESHALSLALSMPCTGSTGAGEQFRLNVTLMAVVA